MRQIDFQQWLQYLFLALVEDDEKQGGRALIDLAQLADQLGYEYPRGWVAKAADVFKSRGWAEIHPTMASSPDHGLLAILTGRGYEAYNSSRWPRPINRSSVTPVKDGKPVPSAKPPSASQPASSAPVSSPGSTPRVIIAPAAAPPSQGPAGPEVAQATVSPTVYNYGPNAQITITQNNTVNIDRSSAEFRELKEQVAQLLEAIRGSNELSPEAKQQLTGEVQAGMRLMEAPKVSRDWIDILVLRPVRFLATTFAKEVIGSLAKGVVSAISKLLGIG